MNSLKPVFVVAVLVAVAYGVYVAINRDTRTADTRTDAPAFPGPPTVQIPGPGRGAAQFPPGPAGSNLASGAPAYPRTVPGAGPSVPGALQANRGATTAPSYLPPGTTTTPRADPAHTAMNPYPDPSGGSYGTSGNLALPTGRAARSDPLSRSGSLQGLSPRPNVLRGPEDATSDPFSRQSPSRQSPHNGSHDSFVAYMEAVQKELDTGRLAEAHLALSSLYDSPEVPSEKIQTVIDLLDQLAGTVIYSREHLLEPPYRVQMDDSPEKIAERYNVPWQLLANINGIRDLRDLRPGQELKVVRGPFSAVVNLERYELTLLLNGAYAGRFPIGTGRDNPSLEGSFVICDKSENPQYYGPDTIIDANDPNNPLGEFWIGLGERIGQPCKIGIHGTNDPQNLHCSRGRGAISLGDQDIRDVYGILSIGSRVVVRR